MHGKRRLRGSGKQWVSLHYQCTAASELNTARAVCIGQKVNAPKLDALVWDYVQELAEDADLIVQAIRAAIDASGMNDNVESLRQGIPTCGARREQFVEDVANPNLLADAREGIFYELSSTEQMIEGLEL